MIKTVEAYLVRGLTKQKKNKRKERKDNDRCKLYTESSVCENFLCISASLAKPTNILLT